MCIHIDMAKQNWAQQNRKDNVNWVLSRVKSLYRNNGEDMPERKIIAVIQMELGVTSRKAKDYLNTLLDAEQLRKKDENGTTVLSISDDDKRKIDQVNRR